MSMEHRSAQLLRKIGAGRQIHKDWFESLDLAVAKQLMWDGYIESAGVLGDFVALTPVGRHAVDKSKE